MQKIPSSFDKLNATENTDIFILKKLIINLGWLEYYMPGLNIATYYSVKLYYFSDFQTIFFHSHDVSKPDSSSFLNQVVKCHQF